MTAIATGAKTRLGVIGIGQATPRGDCASVADNTLLSFIELAESAGLRTGIVTTTRLTHATPASVYAHGPDRNWEDDSYLPADKAKAGCRDLAAQWLDFDFGDGVDIALAGGRAKFTPKSLDGMRKDGRNLVLHEFAHKLDMRDGLADGTPPIADRGAFAAWVKTMTDEYERLRAAAADGRATVLDHYGATNPAEFFAVATECFFEKSRQLRERHPALYDVLQRYYGQDPAARGEQ